MERLKPPAFVTTGYQGERSEPTGTQLTATGAASRSLSTQSHRLGGPRPVHLRAGLPAQVKAILTKQQQHLICCLLYRDPVELDRKTLALELADIEAAIAPFAVPATHKDVVAVMQGVAECLQVELPEPAGMALYVKVLDKHSARMLRHAAAKVLANHGYKSFPVPHDFIRYIQNDSGVMRHFHSKVLEWKGNI